MSRGRGFSLRALRTAAGIVVCPLSVSVDANLLISDKMHYFNGLAAEKVLRSGETCREADGGSAPVEDADVVEAEKAALELPRRSSRFTHQVKFSTSLLKADFEEIDIRLAAQGLLGPMQEQGRKGVHRGFTSLKFHS
jgi:hypothetical protein